MADQNALTFMITHKLVGQQPRFMLSQRVKRSGWFGSHWREVGSYSTELQAKDRMKALAEFRVTTKWYDACGSEDVGGW